MEGFTMTAPAGEQQQDKSQTEGQQNGGGAGGEQQILTQEQVNKLLASQKREIEGKFTGYDDLKAKADQFDQLTESTKSDIQRANDTAADMKAKYEDSQKDLTKAQTQLLRQQIAADKNLPPSMWKRVQGSTKEEIESDVDDLLASAGGAGRGGSSSTGSLRSGASTTGAATDKQRAAAALRGVREK